MTISKIEGQRKIRDFIVYDFEWIPHRLDVRCVGVYDGDRYRWYKDPLSFLASELTSKNRGKWFYAHYGGMADAQFLIRGLRQMGFSVKASFAGASAIIVHVTRGKNSWHLIDSFWLLKSKLADVAKSIGMKKTGPEETDEEAIAKWYATVPLPELVEYNEQDCRILWNAIDTFENALLSMGGQLQMTLASCAMHLFRRKYLSHPVETSMSLNEEIKGCYYASRVEVIGAACTRAYYYDINSSFPYSMTFPVPGRLIGTDTRLPDRVLTHEHGMQYILDATIEVPEVFLPTVPYRHMDRIFFPYGRWRAMLTDVDVELMLREGGRIVKVHEVNVFEPFTDLEMYARDMYEKKAKAADGSMEREVYKLLQNALYGKFAETSMKSTMWVNPSPARLRMLRERFGERPDSLAMPIPGVWFDEIEVKVPHCHVPISASITARARMTLADYLMQTENYYYCDTDGFATDDPCLTGKELGALKQEVKCGKKEGVPPDWHEHREECSRPDGVFVAPKLYKLGGMVKGKGFSLGKAKTFRILDEKTGKVEKEGKVIGEHDAFTHLVEGAELEVVRMRRMKENLRLGNLDPEERPMWKGLRRDSLTKRMMYPDGHTRPWHVSEIIGNSSKSGSTKK